MPIMGLAVFVGAYYHWKKVKERRKLLRGPERLAPLRAGEKPVILPQSIEARNIVNKRTC